MLTAIAIDDEPKALEIIALHAAKLPFLDLRHSFRDALEAIAWLQQHSVDVIFLDINMPKLSGLEFHQLIGEQTMIIFTTAYSDYAVDSYEQGAVDYLVKPIRFERFMKAVLRAGQRKGLPTEPTAPPSEAETAARHTLYVKSGAKLVRLRVEDILFLQKDGNYIYFHTTEGKRVMTRLTTAQALDLLPDELFFQTHKSYIVALAQVREATPYHVLVGGEEVPVAKERWAALLGRLGMG